MSQFSLLKDKRFLPLFLTQFSGAFNDNVFKNALVILITYRAGAATGMDPRLLVTLAAGIFILPFFLFSATAGQIADRFEKARLLRIVKSIETPVMGLAAVGFVLENYVMLLAVLFCAGAQAAFFGPLKYSILPELLKEDELTGANALVEAGTFTAILLGTILGGVVILKDGGIPAVSGIIVAVAVLGWVASLGIPRTAAGAAVKVGWNFIAETWRLTRRSYAEKTVFLSLIGISWFWLVGFTFLAQFPAYVSAVLGGNADIVTLFLTVFSVGIALGSLLCGKLIRGRARVSLGAFGMTAGIVLFWLATPRGEAPAVLLGLSQFIGQARNWGILASLLAIAVSGGIYIVPLYVVMQTKGDAGHRSRTVAVNNVLNALFMVAGAVFAMALLKLRVGVPEIFLVIGLANIPVAFLARLAAPYPHEKTGKNSP